MAMGCRSVGNPGKGSVAKFTAVGRSGCTTRKPSGSRSTSAPAAPSLVSTNDRCLGFTPRTVTSPRVMDAAIPQVAATMRSPITRCSVGCSRSTPRMVNVEDPAPDTCAPILFSIAQRSAMSGSRAALSMTVSPSARTAAMRMFSVAPTDGKASRMVAPCNFSAVATTQPCSISLWAPSRRRPDWCMSSGREPMASPPGSATTARRHRATRGPSTQTEARNWRTAAKSAWYFGSAGVVMRTVSATSSTSHPSPRSTSAMSGTSRMSGQFAMVVVPSASSAAAINFSTLFFAPPTETSPERRLPPVTRKRSLTTAKTRGTTVGSRNGGSSDLDLHPDG